jgi:hypothetical protein
MTLPYRCEQAAIRNGGLTKRKRVEKREDRTMERDDNRLSPENPEKRLGKGWTQGPLGGLKGL